MLTLASKVKSLIHIETSCRTDSLISPLHYKATAAVLLISCAVVSSQQYFGSPIECIQDINGDDAVIPANVINSFCFITATYTQRATKDGHLSNLRRNDSGSQLHSYYQWVPIVLFLQAILFVMPRALWSQVEGGLISGCLKDFSPKNTYPSLQKVNIPSLAKYLSQRIHFLTVWSLWHVGHDLLNFFNAIFNIYLIDIFLGRKFMSYGVETTRALFGHEQTVSPVDDIFPKLTKCEFHKYGPSGSLQRHDALCLMAMNIMNEKLYYILWIWLIFVASITGIMLFLRLFKLLLLSIRFRFTSMGRVTSLHDDSSSDLQNLLDRLFLTDIIFLEQLKVNLDSEVFKQLMESIAALKNDYNFNLHNEYLKLN